MQECLRLFSEALDLDPGNTVAMVNLAVFLRNGVGAPGDLERSEELIERAHCTDDP